MWPYPKIVAHRGGGILAPENTLAALRCGLAHGFRAVEFDVMLSCDQVPLLMHDPDLGRTVPGQGSIADRPAAALLQLDAGAWFGRDFAGEPVPSYWQAMQFCAAHGIWMNVEIKPVPGHEAATGRIAAAATRRFMDEQPGALRPPLLSSFSFEALDAARQAAPGLARGYLADVIPDDWQDRLRQLEAVSLHTNHRNLSAAQAAAVGSAGYGLFCYTVNDPARAREILAWGVDGFCTDRIDLIGADF